MRKLLIAASVMGLLVMTLGITLVPGSMAAGTGTPRWVKHATSYPGSLSGSVRESLDSHVIAAQRQYRSSQVTSDSTASVSGTNVQMNDDSNPPLPQNETSVDYKIGDPSVAVAASNDYVSGGVAIMSTANGGQTWSTTRITPQFVPTRDFCTGGDPSVAYSLRDHAFYVSQLCFFRSQPYSEIHLFKSVDGGKTWTPGRLAAVADSNTTVDPSTGEITVDPSVFLDKEYITIDNNAGRPTFGRIYMSYTRFHLKPSGFSNQCPIRLAYTDHVPTQNPSLAIWHHSVVVPNDGTPDGLGTSANQFSVPQVGQHGEIDVTYVSEECNTALDHHLYFRQSTDGGNTFSDAVRIDHPGEFKDNPDPSDLLPNKSFRAPISPTFDVNKATGTLAYAYQNNLRGQADISVNFSRDGGATWSHARYLSVNAAGTPVRHDQYFPWIDSDPSGTFHAIWFDNRRDPANKRIDTFAADFSAGGQFNNYRISTKSWNPDKGFFSSGAFIGDYNGLAASSSRVYPVWTDGRNSNYDTNGVGETDIFTDLP